MTCWLHLLKLSTISFLLNVEYFSLYWRASWFYIISVLIYIWLLNVCVLICGEYEMVFGDMSNHFPMFNKRLYVRYKPNSYENPI